MPKAGPPPSVFQILERHVGRKMIAILDPSYGFEGDTRGVKVKPELAVVLAIALIVGSILATVFFV